MRRREFLGRLGRAAVAFGAGSRAVVPSWRRGDAPSWRPVVAASLLVPMDDSQTNHLKAYGLTYRAIGAGLRAEWLLNYRGGSFLLPDSGALRREAALDAVLLEPVGDATVAAIKGEIAGANMDAVPLEKGPRIAVYAPPSARPWDDAVTMALQYAGITFDRVWDAEVLAGGLTGYDWLHLHHEDFTGQYSKFYLTFAGQAWLSEMVREQSATARRLGYASVPALKKAVAVAIRDYVANGGFLFAMCTATETMNAITPPSTMPAAPPMSVSVLASTRNCQRISRLVAPRALRTSSFRGLGLRYMRPPSRTRGRPPPRAPPRRCAPRRARAPR